MAYEPSAWRLAWQMEIDHGFTQIPRVLVGATESGEINLCSHHATNPDQIYFDKIQITVDDLSATSFTHKSFSLADSSTGSGSFRCLGVEYYFNDQTDQVLN